MVLMRTALRDSDIRTLIRVVREQREQGAGPDEAWAVAQKAVADAAPEAFPGWKEHVLEQAEADGPAPLTGLNIAKRANVLEAELSDLKVRLSAKGAELEQLRAQLEEKDAAIAKLTDELAVAKAPPVEQLAEHPEGSEAQAAAPAPEAKPAPRKPKAKPAKQ